MCQMLLLKLKIALIFAYAYMLSLWAHTVVYALFQHYDTILFKYYFLIGFVDFFCYHFNITMVILVQGSFNIGPRFKIHYDQTLSR